MARSPESTQATPTRRRYLRIIFALQEDRANRPLQMCDIAAALRIRGSTLTRMLSTLADAGLIDYEPHRRLRLTASGLRIASAELRRVRLLKSFFMSALSVNDTEIEADAERLAEVVSDRLVCRIDDCLSHPVRDPCGDPIPRIDGSVEARSEIPLASIPEKTAFRIVRVLRRDADFSRWLAEMGMGIDSVGIVLGQRLDAGLTVLQIAGKEIAIGRTAAQAILADFDSSDDDTGRER